MKNKIVNETAEEFILNENFFDDVIQNVKNTFKKIGRFFVKIVDGIPLTRVIAPINIGIMNHDNLINNAVTYVANKNDIKRDPKLKSLTFQNLLDKRGEYSLTESVHMLFEEQVSLKHPDANVPNIGKEFLYMTIEAAIRDKRKKNPPMIWGAPGIGKTEIVKSVFKMANPEGHFLDVQTSKMQPDDWSLPYVTEQEMRLDDIDAKDRPKDYKRKVGWRLKNFSSLDIPKSWLPVYIPTGDPEIDKILDDEANDGAGGIIFLDELSRASKSMQASCLKLVGERVIGDAKLGSKWTIIAASNREMDDPDSEQNYSTALGNRFQQFNYVPSFEDWKEWAIGKIDPRILDFLEFNPQFFYNLDNNPDKSIFASPRGWEKASYALAAYMQDSKGNPRKLTKKQIEWIIGGSVGMDAAISLATFMELLKTFNKSDITGVFKHPKIAKLPKRTANGLNLPESNAIISILCSYTKTHGITPEEFANYARYIVRLDNATFAVKALKMMVDINPEIEQEVGDIGGGKLYNEGIDILEDKYGGTISKA